MRRPLYDVDAPKQAVSLALNTDLHAKACAAGLDMAAIAEKALAAALIERIREEIRQDAAACDRFVAEHGSFAEMVQEHYAAIDENAPV